MKRADLKAGEIYAVRRAQNPRLLLSPDVYRWKSSDRQPDSYDLAPPGTKPRRDPQYWGYTRTNYGYLTLEGDLDTLAGIDVESALAAIVAGKSAPVDTSVKVVTESSAILAPYAVHQANEQAKHDAYIAQRDRERVVRAAAQARHDAVARRLNAILREDVLRRADEHSTPTHIELPIAQAEALADLLDAIRAGSEN